MIVRKPKNGERYGRWRCNISKCRKEKSFLAGTFFSGSHVTTKKVFAMAYWWTMKYGGEEDWVREFGVASHTVVDWRNSFRDVCAQYLETNNIKKEIEEPGSVNIVGGHLGDAFIGFASDEDARLAMLLDGRLLHNSKIRLMLSSKREMEQVISSAQAFAGKGASMNQTENNQNTFSPPDPSQKESTVKLEGC
uniref:RRM domain-containing protein n=1 Tax=Meloidogyne javanica TaxID=6303 RepID=A0A915LDR1_MELJA